MIRTIDEIIEYFIKLKRESFMELDSGLDLNEKFIAMYDSLRCLEGDLMNYYYRCLRYGQETKKCKMEYNLRILYRNILNFRQYVLELRTCKTNYIAFLNGSYPKLKKKLDEIDVDLFYISTGENVFDLYYDFWDKAYMLLNNIKIHDCEKCNKIDIVERDFTKEPHI